jgi:hypothetical protein
MVEMHPALTYRRQGTRASSSHAVVPGGWQSCSTGLSALQDGSTASTSGTLAQSCLVEQKTGMLRYIQHAPLLSHMLKKAQRQIPGNPQDISTSDLFVSHPPAYTDPWLLFVKAMLIFGRVTDFNTRGNLRTSIPPSASQNPFGIPGFQTLDHLVCTVFLESLPALYKSSYGLCDSLEGSLDTDLYMVHITPHACVSCVVGMV